MEKRNYSFVKNNHQNKKKVRCTNLTTNEVTIYNSMYAIQLDLGINAGVVKAVCEGIDNCKSGLSKKTNTRYKFEYTLEEPTKKVNNNCNVYHTPEERKQGRIKKQREHLLKLQKIKYECECGAIIKASYKYFHSRTIKHQFLLSPENYLMKINI